MFRVRRLGRILLNAATVLSLMACVGVAVVWAYVNDHPFQILSRSGGRMFLAETRQESRRPEGPSNGVSLTIADGCTVAAPLLVSEQHGLWMPYPPRFS